MYHSQGVDELRPRQQRPTIFMSHLIMVSFCEDLCAVEMTPCCPPPIPFTGQ